MLIHNGTQERLISESTGGAGSTSREGSIQTDSLVATLWVDAVTSGQLSVTVYTLTATGKEVELFSFPDITAPSSFLLLKKSGISMQRFRVVATYTGQCQYEVYIRAVEGAGESSSRILGSNDWRVSQTTIGTTASILIPAALTDRQGVVLKNWSSVANVFVAHSSAAATTSVGYPLAPRDGLALDIAAGAEVWGISDTVGADMRIAEAGT